MSFMNISCITAVLANALNTPSTGWSEPSLNCLTLPSHCLDSAQLLDMTFTQLSHPPSATALRPAIVLSVILHGQSTRFLKSKLVPTRFGWSVRHMEAMHDGEAGWTAIAMRDGVRHPIHANDITLAVQELTELCEGR